jgi:hypothetical protein
MHHFCTLFDIGYASRGLAMINSLTAHLPNSHITLLCLDEQVEALFSVLDLHHVTTLRLADLETAEPRLADCKTSRNRAEYCWTLSSVLTHHLMQTDKAIDRLTYLDADLLFFSNPQTLFDEMGSRDIAITEHRYSPHLSHLLPFGRFCVQWVSFRRSEMGLACLANWRAQCLDWCFAHTDAGRYGDQKYLDAWPDEYGDAVCIMDNIGAGAAPWNFVQYAFGLKGDTPTVNGQDLVFYHFHQFKKMRFGLFSHCSFFYSRGRKTPKPVYRAYEAALDAAHDKVASITGQQHVGITPIFEVMKTRIGHFILPTAVRNRLRKLVG